LTDISAKPHIAAKTLKATHGHFGHLIIAGNVCHEVKAIPITPEYHQPSCQVG